MACTKKDLINWLDTLPEDASVGIDEDGLSLFEIQPMGNGAYCEVGGMPEPPIEEILAKPEHELTWEQLREKYDHLQPGDGWSEHPDFPREDWCFEAGNNDTQIGYWQWVELRIEDKYFDQEHGVVDVDDDE
jgi:hypothetical protein